MAQPTAEFLEVRDRSRLLLRVPIRGDRVLVGKYSGSEIKIGDEDLVILGVQRRSSARDVVERDRDLDGAVEPFSAPVEEQPLVVDD